MSIAIVTGADGFIGQNLVKQLLTKGYEVYAIGIDEKKMLFSHEKMHFIAAFFEDYPNLLEKLPAKADLFFHLAWNGVFGEAFKDYSKQLLNVKYCCDALVIAKTIGCSKFILASTINVLETKRYLSMEKIQPRYTNIYAMSKLSAEMICKTLAFNTNIEFNCALIAMSYGENNYSKMIPNVVMENILKGVESNLVDYDLPYDLIYSEDIANAFIAIGEKGINQRTYYIGHNELSTFGKLFSEIRDILNPDAVLNFGKYLDSNAIDYSLIDLGALQRDTGWIPQTDFRETIIRTANWLKSKF